MLSIRYRMARYPLSELKTNPCAVCFCTRNLITPKPLTFSKNRLRGAKNRSNTSPRILIIMNVLEGTEVGFLKGITVWEIYRKLGEFSGSREYMSSQKIPTLYLYIYRSWFKREQLLDLRTGEQIWVTYSFLIICDFSHTIYIMKNKWHIFVLAYSNSILDSLRDPNGSTQTKPYGQLTPSLVSSLLSWQAMPPRKSDSFHRRLGLTNQTLVLNPNHLESTIQNLIATPVSSCCTAGTRIVKMGIFDLIPCCVFLHVRAMTSATVRMGLREMKGPTVKIDEATPWDLKGRKPTGEYEAEGGSDWMKDAGEEGGAMKGIITVLEVFVVWVDGGAGPGAVDSGTRRA
ncbi:hypothetical protein LXL04_035223 [Taraxacum kok-saghyz]